MQTGRTRCRNSRYIQQANPGVGDFMQPGDVLVIPSPDAFVPLPVVEDKRIVVSISKQKLWAYENGAVKWEWLGSTGIASSPTSPGVYQAQSHQLGAYASIWNLDMPYFLGIYEPAQGSDFMNGIHSFPKRNGSQILWTGNLGAPITFGCVLVSSTDAKLLYDWAQDGVVVEIQI
jgi:lipoprotein-anchoring transpeptidase ErfK/SrfK